MIPSGVQRTDRRFVESHLSRQPSHIARALSKRYEETLWKPQGRRLANLALLDFTAESRKWTPGGLAADVGDEDLRMWAKCRARDVRRMLMNHADEFAAYAAASNYITGFNLKAPKPSEQLTVGACIKRMACARWWTRQLRRRHMREIERQARALLLVHKRAGLYVSQDAFQRWDSACHRNALTLAATEAVNEAGQVYSVADLAALGVSNPELRRKELMTRIRGIEEVAGGEGDAGLFVTWTAPSRMHAVLSASCQRNPKYDGSNPRQVQQYLTKQWAKARAEFARERLRVYGLRVVEPHHDGTPHWHMMLFAPEQALGQVQAIIQHYALQADGDEAGARERRATFTKIDPARGSAAGYVAKYIAKAINGHGLEYATGDGYEADPKEASNRARAWASTWGIRQFQFLGSPTVTVWRELRRLREPLTLATAETLRAAADLGDWAAYMRAQGGPCMPRATQAGRLVQLTTGELGSYGEPVKLPMVRVGCFDIKTRLHNWSIRYVGRAICAPWTRVNNCTDSAKSGTYGGFSSNGKPDHRHGEMRALPRRRRRAPSEQREEETLLLLPQLRPSNPQLERRAGVAA